ncbi:MAG: hypothetical protein V3U14_05350, partial [candidate division NC10 bacterium]
YALRGVQAFELRIPGGGRRHDQLLHRYEKRSYPRSVNFNYIHLGIATARRAWVEKKDVLNSLPLDQLLKRLAR